MLIKSITHVRILAFRQISDISCALLCKVGRNLQRTPSFRLYRSLTYIEFSISEGRASASWPSDKFPTSAVHCCAKWGEICNERRHLGYIDHLLTFALQASNQVVGSSNLSGRANINKGLPISVGSLFYQRNEIVTSFVTISKPRSIRAAAPDKCSGAKCAYRSTISYDFQPPNSINSCRLVPFITCQLAQVWRKSWNRNFSIPARERERFQADLLPCDSPYMGNTTGHADPERFLAPESHPG